MICQVLLADDYEPWRRQVRALLQDHPRWSIVAEVSDGLEAVRKAHELKPDLILLDISLPGLNGLAAAREILAADPHLKILFVSSHQSPALAEAALRVGARGCVLKSHARRLSEAMEAVSVGKIFISVD